MIIDCRFLIADPQALARPCSVHFDDPKSELTNQKWFVIHTRPRCEKKMDAWLAGHGFPHYLPLRHKTRAYPGKRVVFQHPLFPGYAFGAFSLRDRNAVYGSGHAAAVLDVADQARLISELAAIRTALASGLEVEDCAGLVPGRRARITSGKLRGLEGTILRRAGRTKLVLSVELLQRAVAVEIDPSWLDPLA